MWTAGILSFGQLRVRNTEFSRSSQFQLVLKLAPRSRDVKIARLWTELAIRRYGYA